MIGYILLIYLIFYFGAAFVLPSYRVWKRTGVNPVTFRGADTAHDYIGKLFKIVMLVLTLAVIIYAFAPNFYPYLLPITWLENRTIQMSGIGLLLLSLAWTIRAQIQMGNSWRIGIDEEKKTALVQTGIFSFSRNPIFLGMSVKTQNFEPLGWRVSFSFCFSSNLCSFFQSDLNSSIQESLRQPKYKTRFVIKTASGIRLLETRQIAFVQMQNEIPFAFDAAGNKFPLGATLTELEETLDPKAFFRLNRSEIVNLDFIENLKPDFRDRLVVRLRNLNIKLISSASRTPNLRK